MKGSQRYFCCHVPHHERKQAVVDSLRLKDISYESSQLKPKSNTMAEKRKSSVIKDSASGEKKLRKGRWYCGVKDISHSCHRFDVDWGMLANSILRHPLLVLECFCFQHKESGSPSSSAITKGRFRYFEKTGLLKMSQARLTKIDIALTVVWKVIELGTIINYYSPPTHNWAQRFLTKNFRKWLFTITRYCWYTCRKLKRKKK